MDLTTEWDVICRICLQDGEMRSIFELDEDNVIICNKIMHCSNIKIEKGVNLPENICLKCYEDLRVACLFKDNCEKSDIVLQSFLKGSVTNKCSKSFSTATPPETTKNKNKYEEIKEDHDDLYSFQTVEIKSEDEVEILTESIQDEEDFQEYTIEMPEETNNEMAFEVRLVDTIGKDPIASSSENENMIEHKDKVALRKTKKKKKSKVLKVAKQDSKKNIRKCSKEPKTHVCELCGNIYKQKSSLMTHMRRHRNEKPFVCEICEKAFVLNVELKCHMRTHTGQKPYECRYCDRRFADFGSRIKHERTHTGERPYACESCGKTFAYSYGLSSHMLTHTGEKPFQCLKCNKRFTKKHHLKNHLTTHLKQEGLKKTREMMASINKDYMKTPELEEKISNEKEVNVFYISEDDGKLLNFVKIEAISSEENSNNTDLKVSENF